MARAKQSPPPWRPDVGGFFRFQQRYLRRAAEYADTIGGLAGKGSVEPGAWIQGYATFLSGLIGDLGDLVLEPAREPSQGDDWVPLYRGKLHRNEGAAALRLGTIPRQAFESAPGAQPKRTFSEITLTTDGLVPRGGGLPLVLGKHLSFSPAAVDRANRRATLKLFGLRDVVVAPTVYDGVIRANETRRPVAVVEIRVQ